MITKRMKNARPKLPLMPPRISIKTKIHKSMIDYQDNEMLFRFTCLKIPVGYNHLKKQSFFLLFKQCTGTLPKRYFHADSWPIYVNRKSTEYKQLIENLEAHKIDYSIIFINLQFTLPL